MTAKLRQCSNCLRMVKARNHAAEFICDDCRAMIAEREDHERTWKEQRKEVEAYIRQNWREMKRLAKETWEAV